MNRKNSKKKINEKCMFSIYKLFIKKLYYEKRGIDNVREDIIYSILNKYNNRSKHFDKNL